MVVRWTFYDPNSTVTYTFDVNPNQGGSPARKKTITTRKTSAPKAKPLIFEGADEPQAFSWSGTLLEESQLIAFKAWLDRRHQIQFTDDLGRSAMIYITKFDFKRVRAAGHHWKHTYTATAMLLDWP